MSTYDAFFASLNAQQKKDFEQEYRKLVLSELLIALMAQNKKSENNGQIRSNNHR